MTEYTDVDKSEDMKILHGMGYAQELERRMSQFSNFAVSFSIICILSGGINSLAQATSGAGGAAIGIGWPLGCFISLVFAVAMAQISSAYPTAGGLYHWGSILGNRFTGWLTAWFNLLGLITVLGAINVGTYYFFMGAFGGALGLEDTTTTRIIFLAIITGLQALVNHMGIGLTAKLTDFSGYLIFATAIALALVCLVAADTWEFGRLFTLKAAHSVPRAMIGSVLWSALFGYIMLCAFVLMLPSMDEAATQGWNVFFWGMDQQVNPAVKNILYLAIFVAQWLCGLATVTSASRMIFAFSRDGGLPASSALAKVSPTYRTPVAAIWTGSILAVLFVWGSSLVSIGDTPVYTIVVSCTVIFLFFSFIIPITLGLMAWGTSKWDKQGPWNLGEGMFKLFAVLSIIAMVLIFVIGIQPPNDWALYITVGFLIVTGIVWFGFERSRFKGPPIGDEVAKRAAAAERAVGETGH
jgi:amino acid transporter